MHSALGAGIAAIKHEDIAAGAIAAPLGEMISETYGKYQKSQIQQDYKDGKISVREVSERLSNAKVSAVEVAKVGTAVAAHFTGRDVNTATNAAGNAAENNFVPVLVAGAVIAMQIATQTKKPLFQAVSCFFSNSTGSCCRRNLCLIWLVLTYQAGIQWHLMHPSA